MSGNVDAEEVARELRRGYEVGGGMGAVEALSNRLADEILVWHKPRIPVDGKMTAAFVEKMRRKEVATYARAMPDYHETGRISVKGSEIFHDMIVTGTYKRNRVNFTYPCIWTVEQGKIVRMGGKITLSPAIWLIRFMLGI